MIAFTADHGECFENGVFFDHSQCLGEGALAVPLVLRAPGLAPGRTPAPVEQLDVAPTLLRLAGLEVPATFDGRGLLERRASDTSDTPDVFFQHPLYRRTDVADRQAVLDRLRAVAGEPTRRITGDRLPFGRGPWKYVRSGAEEALYNLAEDPGERADLAGRHPELVRELRHAVWQWLQDHPVALRDTGELDPKLVESLEALGYL